MSGLMLKKKASGSKLNPLSKDFPLIQRIMDNLGVLSQMKSL